MGFVDSLLGAMSLGDDAYEEDYYDEEEFEEEEEFESKRKVPFGRKSEEKAKLPARVVEEPKAKEKPQKPVNKVTPFRTGKSRQGEEMGVCVIKPTSLEDETEIVETLLKERTVVINMEGLNYDIAQRIIDFVCGGVTAIGGKLQRVSNFIFIATPPSVDISGDFSDLLGGSDSGIQMY